MAYTNMTPYKHLPQYVPGDRQTMADVNEAYRKIDSLGQPLDIAGSYATLGDLQTAYPAGDGGRSYIAGTVIYVWDGTAWVSTGIDLTGYHTAAEVDALLAAIHGTPAGGTAGQVLKKASDDDHDVLWDGAGDMLAATYDPNHDGIIGIPQGGIGADMAAARAALGVPLITSGTWTLTLYGASTPGSPTYLRNNGYYIKIGNFISLHGSIKLSNIGGMVGQVIIGGLPFVSATEVSGSVGYLEGTATSKQLVPYMQGGTSYMVLTYNNSGSVIVQTSDITNSFGAYGIVIQYYTA